MAYTLTSSLGERVSRRALTVTALSLAALTTVAAMPAAAQRVPPPRTELADQYCKVFAIEVPGEEVKQLRAGCRGNGIVLGAVTSFDVSTNEALGATLVDARLGSERRILLLTANENGVPLVEDLTGQLAHKAGRGPMSDLHGVELDLRGFTSAGLIHTRGAVDENVGGSRMGEVDIRGQLTAEVARGARANLEK